MFRIISMTKLHGNDIMKQNHLLANVILRNVLSERAHDIMSASESTCLHDWRTVNVDHERSSWYNERKRAGTGEACSSRTAKLVSELCSRYIAVHCALYRKTCSRYNKHKRKERAVVLTCGKPFFHGNERLQRVHFILDVDAQQTDLWYYVYRNQTGIWRKKVL